MIRELVGKDTKAFVELMHTYYLESNMTKCAWSEMVVLNTLYTHLHNPEAVWFVSEKDGKIIGAINGQLVSPMFSSDVVVECSILYVHPEYRGTHTGVSLLKKLDKWGKDMGAKYIHIGVTSGINTERTANLYRKLGYTYVGQEFRKEVE